LPDFLRDCSVTKPLSRGFAVFGKYNSAMTSIANNEVAENDVDSDPDSVINEARLWRNNGWTARVIKNEDDEGWAVEMIKDGEAEPALVGPWTMGRDKKNPKPLDASAFQVLVKTASEVIRRHEHHLHAMLHKKLSVNGPNGPLSISLDIEPDEDDPYAVLSATDAAGELLAQVRVAPNFKFSVATVEAWIADEFRQPE
jgi:hypothetical protein